jgi:integrase
MSRAYKGVRLKKNRVYTVQDLMDAYKVSQNTVSNWTNTGLRPSDEHRPHVFRGAVVTSFHDQRRARKLSQLRRGEFKCVACKMAVFPTSDSVTFKPTRSGASFLSAVCPECSASIHRLGSEADLAVLRDGPNPNTSEDFAHEEKRSGPADIGIIEDSLGSVNDRIIHKWQTFAGRYSEKTIDRHLESIRFFEKTIDQKPFDRLTEKDVEKCRSTLKRALEAEGEGALSKSTVQHHASHIRAFLEWLLKQDGFKRLPNDLSEYIALPKAAYAAGIPTQPRPYPTIDEAREMLLAMPDRTLRQKRDRAIFALAFLGALRADTLISLRFGDIDVEHRKIIQDARRSRTKNGKSQQIVWFPIPIEFEETVNNWCQRLKDAGFEGEDALFPEAGCLEHDLKFAKIGGGRLPIMRSKHAVTQAFKAASANCMQAYTPHSARHTIAHERDVRPLTHEERRAWSENMGHENEQITDTHYAKMSDDRRFEVFEAMIDDAPSIRSNPLDGLTDEELGACVREALSRKRQ